MVYFLFEDGNSELKGKFFPLGRGIRKHLENILRNYNGDKAVEGYKRLNNILSMENGITYEEMKRIKNFFDNFQGDTNSPEYILNGGQPMALWVTNTLNTATKGIKDFKQTKKDAGFKNAFIRPHEKDRQNSPGKVTQAKIQTTNVNRNIANNTSIKYESKTREVYITETQLKDIYNKLNKR